MALSTSDQDIIASIQSQLDGLRKTTDGEFLYRLIERGLKRRGQDFEGDTGQAFVAFLHNILGRYAATPSGDTVTRVKVRLIQRRIASHMLEPHPEAEATEQLPVEPIETPVEEIVTHTPTDRDSAPNEPLESDPLQVAVDELLAESAEVDGTESPSGKIQEEASQAQPEPVPEPARDSAPTESADQVAEEDEAAQEPLRFRRVPEDESVPRADPNRPLFADLMDELDLGIPDDEPITLDAETVEPDPVAAPEAKSGNEEPPVPDMEPVTVTLSESPEPPKEAAPESVPVEARPAAEATPPTAKPEPAAPEAKPVAAKAAPPVEAPQTADAEPKDKIRTNDREPKTGQDRAQEKASPPAPSAEAEPARPGPEMRKAATAPVPKASREKKATQAKSASPEKGKPVSAKPKPAAAKPKPASKKKKKATKQASAQKPEQPSRTKPKQSLQLQDTWGPAAPEAGSDEPDIVVGESAAPAWTRPTEPVPPAAAADSIFAAPQPLAPPPAAAEAAKQDPAPVVPAATRTAEPESAAPPAEGADPRDRVDKLHETFANKLADSISRSREYHTLLRSSLKRLKLADGARDIGDLKQLLLTGLEELLQGSESLGKDLGATSHYLRISQLDRDLLKDELTRVRDQSLVDDVTGLNNRAGFMRQLEAEIGRTKRYGFSLSVAVLHMEALAEIARKDGKDAVNEILRTYAKEILSNFRGYDCVARIGEHRFGILFPNTQKEGAMTALDKAHKRAASMVIQHKGASFKVPPFTSVLTLYSQGDKPDALLQRADEAFALAREQDRDRIIVALPGN